MERLVLPIFGFFLFAVGALAQPTSTLVIDAGEAGTHNFVIEIADTPELIERGLMERETLAADAGVLFDYSEPRDVSMWMKDTPLSLDMLFIDASGKVVAIARNTVPQSERKISAGTPVRAVLELNAGTSKALNIEPGSLVRHALFDTEGDAEARAQ